MPTANSRQSLSDVIVKAERKWQRLADSYLVVKKPGSLWRFSRSARKPDPDQGWKLHISATVLTANDVLKAVAPRLIRAGVLFKAPISLQELENLNRGIFYGFSQIGKFITVYPRTDSEAVLLAAMLDQSLRRFSAPSVPYDARLRYGSSIFYRYGAFGSLQIEEPKGTFNSAITMPSGKVVIDRREPGHAVPNWLQNPFPRAVFRQGQSKNSPLKTTIHVYRALSQRGKGGVYEALDTSVSPMRSSILKEGRKHGETGWDGRDGYYRVRHEEKVLLALRSCRIPVPQVYRSFKSKRSYYVLMEKVEGRTLSGILQKSKRPIPVKQALHFGIQLARLLETIHKSGWVWRDCKPLNLIVTEKGVLRPVDFEGACSVKEYDPMPWGTPGYVPKESNGSIATSRVPEDVYALGATLYHLFTGRISSPLKPFENLSRSRRTPVAIRNLIVRLADDDPSERPTASSAKRILQRIATTMR